MKRTLFLSSIFISLLATPVMAHTGQAHINGFTSGLLHPLLGMDHILAMIAVGLLASQRQGKIAGSLPIIFILMMLVGAAVGLTDLAIPFAEQGIIGSVIILGAVLAAGHRISNSAAAILVGLFASFHGIAHIMEVPANVSSIVYASGFSITTIALIASGFVLGKTVPTFIARNQATSFHKYAGAALSLAGLGLATA